MNNFVVFVLTLKWTLVWQWCVPLKWQNRCFWETYRNTSGVINWRISLNQQDLFFVDGITCIGSKTQHVVVKKNSQKVPFWHRDNFFYIFCFFFFNISVSKHRFWLRDDPSIFYFFFLKITNVPKPHFLTHFFIAVFMLTSDFFSLFWGN